MNYPDSPAFPVKDVTNQADPLMQENDIGLTKHEYAVIHIAAGMFAGCSVDGAMMTRKEILQTMSAATKAASEIIFRQ